MFNRGNMKVNKKYKQLRELLFIAKIFDTFLLREKGQYKVNSVILSSYYKTKILKNPNGFSSLPFLLPQTYNLPVSRVPQRERTVLLTFVGVIQFLRGGFPNDVNP